MPFLARLLARLFFIGVINAMRRSARGGMPPPWRTPGTGARGRPPAPGRTGYRPSARQLADARQLGGLLGRLLAAAVLVAATAVLVSAGTTTVVLSPRWLGCVLLALAVITGVFAVREARFARRVVMARRLRRAQDRLRRETP